MFRVAEPLWLIALALIPLYLWFELKLRRGQKLRLSFSRVDLLARLAKDDLFWKYLFPGLRSLLILVIVIALAQPEWGRDTRDYRQKGVDIVIAIDVSGSMLALDFAPDNRLKAAVKVAKEFIGERPSDRFGLVAFSEYAITQSPLTFDHQAMLNRLEKLEVNTEASGTAIGLGLAKAVARLKDSRAKSKIIILVTDGVNNSGEIDPLKAAEMAKAYGIRVYPIGVGSNDYVDFPFSHPIFGIQYQKVFIELDMQTLNRIAAITGTGEAAMAGDSAQFSMVMKQIDKLEKTEFQAKINYNWKKQFAPFLWIAFIMLGLELLFKMVLIPVLPE